ncbi:MAG: DUF927 domain-containing protein [Oscillospiraceae bacterium]
MDVHTRIEITHDDYVRLNKNEPYFPVIIDEDSLSLIYTCNRRHYKRWLATKMIVTRFIQDEISGEKTLEINAQTVFGKEVKELPYAILNRRDITQILQFGWSFPEKDSADIITYLQYSAVNSQTVIGYSSVGWFKLEDYLLFRSNKVIEPEETGALTEKYLFSEKMKLDKLIQTKNYLDDLNSLLTTSGAMLAISAGLSSALISFLKISGVDVENILLHIFGNSSKGKTTFLRLALSMWGNPYEAPLANSFNSTSNAMYATLAGNNGIAIGFDEASCTNNDYTTFIYNIAHGKDKVRLNKNSTLSEQKTWNTTIISTAEESLLSKTKKNNGIRARCLEFFNLNVTKDAEHSERITSFIKANYGYLGTEFVKLLYRKGADEIIKDFNTARTYIFSAIGEKCDISERVSKTYAVLIQTGIYAQELGVKISRTNITKILVEQHESLLEDTNMAEKIYDNVVAFISENKYLFPDTKTSDFKQESALGLITATSYFIEREQFKKILLKNNFTDSQVALKELHNNGYLKKHKDKYYVSKRICGIELKCYEFVADKPVSNKSEQ